MTDAEHCGSVELRLTVGPGGLVLDLKTERPNCLIRAAGELGHQDGKIANIGIISQVTEPSQSIHNMFLWSLLIRSASESCH